ncbi:LptF/LptG family permease [Sphingomonas kyeonggiensis]|uniref:Lipopolysaccharide export system permease protein n=1 Tax=Sphingomonas kyeonggiensis TaxID=1268553 RepID=A0A7W6JX22_9SPHN|nr:LptF/LptG family permease [Sphingomonas kyeonggiensis]MBB4101148.1 lipopolysaccharide export system permease protein [Sphingomonas kyeonggiensis]
MLRMLDRYVACEIARTYLLVLLTIIAILSLENAIRLATAVRGTNAPGLLLAQLMATLLPEYLGIAIPVATFLSVAFAIRALSLRGEWQMLEALGMSPWRYMAAPMLLALLSALLLLAVRLDLQPAGESALDRVSLEIVRGFHGLHLASGEAMQLGDTTLVAERVQDAGPGILGNVLVQRASDVLAAARATISIAPDGDFELTLADGHWLRRHPDGREQKIMFDRYHVRLPGTAGLPPKGAVERMDRLGSAALLAGMAGETGRDRPVSAALAGRIESAFFCMLLPVFAVALAVPPKRRPGGAGILLGILLIVLHLKGAAAVEAASEFPVLGAGLHALFWTGIALALARGSLHHGAGYIDAWFADRAAGLSALLRK